MPRVSQCSWSTYSTNHENNVESMLVLPMTPRQRMEEDLTCLRVSTSALRSQSPVLSIFPKFTANGSKPGPIDQEVPTSMANSSINS